VAVGAGVVGLKLVGQIGAWNAEAVIVPLIDHHEGPLRHMAGHATDRRGDALVMIMRGTSVGIGVALQADLVARELQLGTVRIVTIAAGDAGRVHPALLERAVIIDLIEHLPVRLVESLCQRRDEMRVGKRPSGHPIFGDQPATRVAEPAGLDLLAHARGRNAPNGKAGLCIVTPGHAGPLVESHE
jgi:hypothetical protein